MGVDCYGKNGNEFRNNWWWWRPLAEYCFAIAPDICEGSNHYKRWSSNDGSMTATEAEELATILQRHVSSGLTKAYEQRRQRELEDMPDEICTVCDGTGKVSPLAGLQNHREALKLAENTIVDPDMVDLMRKDYLRHALKDPAPVECHGCHGVGTRRPWDTAYWFSVENVQEFANFLKKSGGFDVR